MSEAPKVTREFFHRRPSLHVLCSGVYLQSPEFLSDGVTYCPIRAMGMGIEIEWLRMYTQMCGAGVDEAALVELSKPTVDSRPVVAVILPVVGWRSCEATVQELEPTIARHLKVLAWATGNPVTEFGRVILGPFGAESYFRLSPPEAIKRQRLGFGNTGSDFTRMLETLINAAMKDENLMFTLELYHDAQHESNARFKIARLYCGLESLAHPLKLGLKSRDAVRHLLNVKAGKTGECMLNGRRYEYDVVLGAGKLRDALFHGLPADWSTAKSHERDTFDLLDSHPGVFVDDLKARLEMQLMRRAAGLS